MAYILKKSEKHTTKYRLTQYFFISLSLGILFTLCTLYFHFVTAKQYDITIEQSICLNQFYSALDQLNTDIGGYWQDNTAIGSGEILAKFDEIDELVEKLQSRRISSDYARDIHDIKEMMNSYKNLFSSLSIQLNALNQDQFNTNLLSKVNETYFEIEEIFEILYSDFKNLHLTMLENAKQIQSDLYKKTFAYTILLATSILLLIAAGIKRSRRLTNQIVQPIQRLTQSAEMILDGKIEEFERIPVLDRENNESMILTNAFNMMIEQIRSQIKEIQENASAKVALHEKELENLRISNLLKGSELKVLQMQINPHFLFNTLNMIAQTAYLGDSDTTVFLLGKTAELLRYSLDFMGKSVTLARELTMLGDYIYLQEQRFGERIEFEFELDESFHQMHIPCLILQPLVENAITHGVGSYTENGKIQIKTSYDKEKECGIISIGDNGLGITPERLSQLRKELHCQEIQREKIGLANVYMRLQIFFDQKADMEIVSVPRKWTEIRLILPYKMDAKTEL